MAWSIGEIVAATEGKALKLGRSGVFKEVVTDSSKVVRGSVFLALKGQRHDGHRFIGDAVRRGARCIIVHRDAPRWGLKNVTVIRVKDTLRALGDMAHYRRQKFAPSVLALTGSNGKTTTKEMVAAILETAFQDGKPLRGKVLKTEGNFNNLVGVPLTLLRLRRRHRVAVLELGTSYPGEIQRLAQIADPDMGMITSVAAAHLEGLRSLAGVAREKGALFRQMRSAGTVAVNLDDPRVRRLGAKFTGRKIAYGKGGEVAAESWRFIGPRGTAFTLKVGRKRCKVRLKFLGEHHIANAVGAAALAHGFGVSLAAIRRGLEKVRPFSMRMEVSGWRGLGIINDAYNANPASMTAAVQTLAAVHCRGERIAVLGDMFELGRESEKQHRGLGEAVAKAHLDRLYLLGGQARHVRAGALRGGMATQRITIGTDHGDIARRLKRHTKKGDWLLFKGSRGMKMEKVLEKFKGGR